MMIIFNAGNGGAQTDDFELENNGVYNASGFTGEYVAAVDGIEIDENAPATYYNMQGIRIDQPTPGLYIVVRGDKVTKELVMT